MAKHMLIDATHPEEIRVVVVDGKRLEEFDIELASKKQLKGNIYLAKVTRVEPSLQAAFVEYGGNRHGFLAFSEIHPDYYRIPVADREALLAEEAREAAAENAREEARDAAADRRSRGRGRGRGRGRDAAAAAEEEAHDGEVAAAETPEPNGDEVPDHPTDQQDDHADHDDAEPNDDPANGDWPAQALEAGSDRLASRGTYDVEPDEGQAGGQSDPEAVAQPDESAGNGAEARSPAEPGADDAPDVPEAPAHSVPETVSTDESVEELGGDETEEDQPRRSHRSLRSYKIQEVIKRRQVMLVQVTKEERGTKGAALTTYLSLAGRYCVLMPNTARGGGVSRKISSPVDRKRLKAILEELEIPEGMAVIIRTAGAERSKAELKRDYEYLLRLWDEIRELTLKSSAPALVYEEANLIKRSIRDLYSRDIEDVIVDGEDGYKVAKAFMRTLTPSHAKRVQLYRDPMPLFHRHQVESQLDAIHNPVVQLKSGGYIVINSTEALVAIDVNSGRATRERNIEETAHKTNLEAADEIARQLRLRDLAGLIVIDFIDMEESRHNAAVERRLKEAMRNDRARIQIGRISPFGLLELSRQRMRPSLFETSTEICEHCRGTGHVRSTESTVLHVLRSIEDECLKGRNSEGMSVAVPTAVALYILNHKRKALAEIELRHGQRIFITGDDHLIPPEYRVERIKTLAPGEQVRPLAIQANGGVLIEDVEAEEVAEDADEEAGAQPAEAHAEAETDGEERQRGRRSRRRRRGRDRDGREQARKSADAPHEPHEATRHAEPNGVEAATDDEGNQPAEAAAAEDAANGDRTEDGHRRRRRGRRGGRRRRRNGDTDVAQAGHAEAGNGDTTGSLGMTEAEGGGDTEAAEDDQADVIGAPSPGTEGRPWSYRSRFADPKPEPAAEAQPAEPQPAESQPSAQGDAGEVEPDAAEPAEAQAAEPVQADTAASPAEEPRDAAAESAQPEESRDVAPEAAPSVAPEPAPAESRAAEPASPKRGWWRRLAQ